MALLTADSAAVDPENCATRDRYCIAAWIGELRKNSSEFDCSSRKVGLTVIGGLGHLERRPLWNLEEQFFSLN